MKSMISFAYQQASPHKNNKSIYNIIIGKKTHQTLFDATSLQLLSLYGCAPHISFEQFEALISKPLTDHVDIPTSTHITYPILQQSFVVLQLLIQTLSQAEHEQLKFVPLTSQIDVHQQVRQIYQYIKTNHAIDATKAEIYRLFKRLNDLHPESTAHYYLSGYDETMYTQRQVGQVTGLDEDALTLSHYIDILTLYQLLSDETQFPVLHHCLVSLPISHTLQRSLAQLIEGWTVAQIAQHTKRTENTIYDHVLELFMRNYLTCYDQYFREDTHAFIAFYMQEPYQRLRYYKEHFEQLSYFEIKLAIIGIAKGDLHA
ncbi:MAG: helix-turn-helix domain-containing protein [Staphylococcus rostri]|uniref:helix-turn-helix domain-containing protein n=1 Tax=Staphylococcus rostri TaxID=522262 RepID=UPI0026DF80AA|nr:helix-turn-helix domain-containing protein [Staphylococcus rostri]MDO5374754.1 helix-turn-helix domain-containing protein [Staphylococcus rostri]